MPSTDRLLAEEHARSQTARFVAELRDAYTPHGPQGLPSTFMLVPCSGDFADRLVALVEDAYLKGAASNSDKA